MPTKTSMKNTRWSRIEQQNALLEQRVGFIEKSVNDDFVDINQELIDIKAAIADIKGNCIKSLSDKIDGVRNEMLDRHEKIMEQIVANKIAITRIVVSVGAILTVINLTLLVLKVLK
jgi:hypothetical protein